MAEYLLKNGLPTMNGVVFLDELDRQMVLIRQGMKVMKLSESGLAWGERFSFYDQVTVENTDSNTFFLRSHFVGHLNSFLILHAIRCIPRGWILSKR